MEATLDRDYHRALHLTNAALDTIFDIGTRFTQRCESRYFETQIDTDEDRVALRRSLETGETASLSAVQSSHYYNLRRVDAIAVRVILESGITYRPKTKIELEQSFSKRNDKISSLIVEFGYSLTGTLSFRLKTGFSSMSIELRGDDDVVRDFAGAVADEMRPFFRWWRSLSVIWTVALATLFSVVTSYVWFVTTNALFVIAVGYGVKVDSTTQAFMALAILIGMFILFGTTSYWIARSLFPLLEVDMGLYSNELPVRRRFRLGLISVPVFAILVPFLVNLAANAHR
jgi:hypothetical protein